MKEQKDERSNISTKASAPASLSSSPSSSTSIPKSNANSKAKMGVHGVRLKKFEEVVADILPSCRPTYVPLPPPIDQFTKRIIEDSVLGNKIFEEKIVHEKLQRLKQKESEDEGGGQGEGESVSESKRRKDDIPDPVWPFDILPRDAGVRSKYDDDHSNIKNNHSYNGPAEPGKLSGMRAVKKEWQLASMIQCAVAMLPSQAFGLQDNAMSVNNVNMSKSLNVNVNVNLNVNIPGSEIDADIDAAVDADTNGSEVNEMKNTHTRTEPDKRITIVDFAGGSGHLSLPLAVLLPKCDIVLVDLKGMSLEFAHQKAKQLVTPLHVQLEARALEEELQQKQKAATDASNIHHSAPTVSKRERKRQRKKKRREEQQSKQQHALHLNVTSTSTECGEHADNKLRRSKHLPNLYTFHGSITAYVEELQKQNAFFDIGMGLHACGEASDIILRACGGGDGDSMNTTAMSTKQKQNQKHPANFIVSPCCVGKLSQKKKNPYIYQATSGNDPTITYPQSSTFCQIISNTNDGASTSPRSGDGNENKNKHGNKFGKRMHSTPFDEIAKAGDYSEMKDMRTGRNATRRTAKALLEMDRLLYMKETYGYDEICLTRMDPWEATPKNDILLGWRKGDSPYRSMYGDGGVGDVPACPDCNADIELAVNQLIVPAGSSSAFVSGGVEVPSSQSGHDSSNTKGSDGNGTLPVPTSASISSSVGIIDWSEEERDEIQSTLDIFVKSPDTIYKFKAGMGKRKRKLIHFLVNEIPNMTSWSEGKKSAEKITVVGKDMSVS